MSRTKAVQIADIRTRAEGGRIAGDAATPILPGGRTIPTWSLLWESVGMEVASPPPKRTSGGVPPFLGHGESSSSDASHHPVAESGSAREAND